MKVNSKVLSVGCLVLGLVIGSTNFALSDVASLKIAVVDVPAIVAKSTQVNNLKAEQAKKAQALTKWIETVSADVNKQSTEANKQKLLQKYNKELANLDNVEILGFTGEIESIPKTLEQVENIRNSCCDVGIIQLMNADAIAGKEHLQQGVIHAINAFKRGENLAKDLGIEILIRTS